MSNADDIQEFLTSRRARLTPERAGLPRYGRQRRVSGLRREEVALLAGISDTYYTRLERGNARGVSQDVLDGIARALQLDESERAHLGDLVRIANEERPPRRSGVKQQVRPSVKRIVDSMAAMPALVRNRRLDVLYANPLGAAFYSEVYGDPNQPPNPARFVFLDLRSREFYVDWEMAAHDMVALLRAEAGRNPYDRALSDLVGELSTRSAEFRVRWAAHDVLFHRNGVRRFRHPLVDELTLACQDLDLPSDPDQTILVFTPGPGSASEESLNDLARRTSTDTTDRRPARRRPRRPIRPLTIPDTFRRESRSTVDGMGEMTIRPAYSKWPEYHRRFRDVVAALTDEQLAVRPAPDRWPLWATVGHAACQRVFWLCDFAGEPGVETTPFTNAAYNCPGDDDLEHVLDAEALGAALDSTFRIVESCLDRWTLAMLDEEIRRPEWDGTWVHTRGSVIQRVFSHDVYHCAELNEALGIAGLPLIDLWD